MIIKLFQAKIKLGQGARAAKTEAIKNLYDSKQTSCFEAALKGNGLFLPEYEKGNGFSDGVKAFVEKTGLDCRRKKNAPFCIKTFIR